MRRFRSCFLTLLMLTLAYLIVIGNLLVQLPSLMTKNPIREHAETTDGTAGNILNIRYRITVKVASTEGRTEQISKGRDDIPESDVTADNYTGWNLKIRNEIPHKDLSANGNTRQISKGKNQTSNKPVSSDCDGQISNGGFATEHAVTSDTGQTMAGDKTHLILMWHWPIYGNALNLEVDVCKERFGVSNCIMVANRSQFPKADFVVFHNLEMVRTHEKLPVNLTRPKMQRWIWFTREGPMHNGDVKHLNGYFNLTMTYRRDSDIYTPYGLMVPKNTVSDEPLEKFIPKNKNKLACWVVSNFKPKHVRTVVYKMLKTVIPIQVYGKGGNGRIDQKDLIPTISRCYFYLAFENNVNKDYITEKLWYNAYRSGAVPVVLGPSRKDYEAVADKDSFIHVNDFKTVEDLGQFLKELANDKERYASYFNWRRKFNAFGKYWIESLCKFCPKISSLPPHKIYWDLDTWQKK